MPFKPLKFLKDNLNVKGLLKKIAPALGAAIGGPFGGIAATVIGKAFNKEDATEEELEQMLKNATPEQLLEIKRLDKEFKAKMKELEIDIFALEVEDRDSARDLFKVNMWPQIGLSVFYTAGYFVVLSIFIAKMFGDVAIDPNILALISALIGLLTGEVPRINAFWFGSSMGSKNKDEKMLRNNVK